VNRLIPFDRMDPNDFRLCGHVSCYVQVELNRGVALP
jgi:hypothetical protein